MQDSFIEYFGRLILENCDSLYRCADDLFRVTFDMFIRSASLIKISWMKELLINCSLMLEKASRDILREFERSLSEVLEREDIEEQVKTALIEIRQLLRRE